MPRRSILKPLFFCLGLTPSLVVAAAPASELDALRQQVEALNQRVEALEQALGQVEARQKTGTPAETTPNSPWEQLHIGMRYSEVEELLGKPVSKQKGGINELWFYSDQKKAGPFVKFVFKQVHSWRGAPADTD